MPKIHVTMIKKEVVEFIYSRTAEISEEHMDLIRRRPTEATVWAKGILAPVVEEKDWHPINNGMKSRSIEVRSVEIRDQEEKP